MNIGGYYGLTLDSAKYELLLNDFYVSMLNQEIVQIFGITFSELKFYGKIFLDLEKMNGYVPRLSLEANLHKDEMKVFHYIFATTETPYKLHFFCPFVFKNMLNIQNVEHIEITHEHVALGKETSITTMCNLTPMKIITKVSPYMMSLELFDGEVSLVKFFGKAFLDLEKMNGFVPRLSLEAQLHKNEMKIFHYIFTTTETPYKLHIFCPYVFKNVLNIQNVEQIEITHEHVVLGMDTTITTMCNLTTKKIITKVSPNMMSIELFDGEVSLVKYVSELTKVMRGTNSLILEGKQGVQFNSYQPCFLPKSLCFHDLMKHFHFEIVDMAAGKVNVKMMVTKDTTEILKVVAKQGVQFN